MAGNVRRGMESLEVAAAAAAALEPVAMCIASPVPAAEAASAAAAVPAVPTAAASGARLQPPPPRSSRAQKRARPLPAGSGSVWTFTPATASNPPLRHVRPYHHEFGVFVKARWVGRTVLDVLISEFKPPAGVLPATAASPTGDDGDEAVAASGEAAAVAEDPAATASVSPAAAAAAYYRRAISLGFVLLNDAPTTTETLLRQGDHLRQRVHRHEPPVLDHAPLDEGVDRSEVHRVRILHMDEQVVVVDKPPSIPVHESGVLRAQSLLAILYAQPGATQGLQLFPVHRLDKLTSGCVILARNAQVAKQLGRIIQFKGEGSSSDDAASASAGDEASPAAKEAVAALPSDVAAASTVAASTQAALTAAAISSVSSAPLISQPGGLITKLYLARCEGHFPSAHALSRLSLEPDGRYRVNAPLFMLDARRGVHVVDAARGVSAVSIVRPLSYDAASHTSVVEVQPLTGRTHQIRLHLQWLGHAIANDPLYGPGLFRGNSYASLRAHPDEAVAQRLEGAWAEGCLDCLTAKYYNPDNESKANLRYATHIYLHALSYSFVPPGAQAQAPPMASAAEAATPAAAGGGTNDSLRGPVPSLSGIAAGFSFTTERPAWAAPNFDVLRDLGTRVQSTPRAADLLQQELVREQQTPASHVATVDEANLLSAAGASLHALA